MFTRIKINLNGQVVEAILLAKFSMKVNVYKKKITKFLWIKKAKLITEHKFTDFCMVYIPWKHRMKEIVLVKNELVIENNLTFIDKTNIVKIDSFKTICGDYTNSEMYVKNFEGYDFIYADRNFIGNVYEYDTEQCLSLLYKNIPEIISEKYDDERIVESLFIPCKNGQGSAYLEFQYCEKEVGKNPFRKIEFKKQTSLLVSANNLEQFLDLYSKFLGPCISPDGSGRFYEFGENYYTKEMAKEIYNKIKRANIKGEEPLLVWLYQAFTEYNGFYILGL